MIDQLTAWGARNEYYLVQAGLWAVGLSIVALMIREVSRRRK